MAGSCGSAVLDVGPGSVTARQRGILAEVRPLEVARARLPTSLGSFDLRAFRSPSGLVHLALINGDLGDGLSVLTRLHSECLTGDAIESLRCDCGIQLRAAMRAIQVEGRGVLIYTTGHEGRGIGLIDKLRAYAEQDRGADTVEANLRLGLPVDGRHYGDGAQILKRLGVRSVQLITNNPSKVSGLRDEGIEIDSVRGLPVAANRHTQGYLEAKRDRLGHIKPLGEPLRPVEDAIPNVSSLMGRPASHRQRPHTIIKYAQSMDGRIATANGDARWISSEEERRVTHAMRARCDAIMVGSGTVRNEDPLLTVRLVPGPSPLRVILDSELRTPFSARVFDEAAPTVVITTDRSDPQRRDELRAKNVAVQVVPNGYRGVDLPAALAVLKAMKVSSLLVEGGQHVITSLLLAGCADRLVVAIAPIVLGGGIEGIGDLGIVDVAHGISLTNRSMFAVGRDVLIAYDVTGHEREAEGDSLQAHGTLRSGQESWSAPSARAQHPAVDVQAKS